MKKNHSSTLRNPLLFFLLLFISCSFLKGQCDPLINTNVQFCGVPVTQSLHSPSLNVSLGTATLIQVPAELWVRFSSSLGFTVVEGDVWVGMVGDTAPTLPNGSPDLSNWGIYHCSITPQGQMQLEIPATELFANSTIAIRCLMDGPGGVPMETYAFGTPNGNFYQISYSPTACTGQPCEPWQGGTNPCVEAPPSPDTTYCGPNGDDIVLCFHKSPKSYKSNSAFSGSSSSAKSKRTAKKSKIVGSGCGETKCVKKSKVQKAMAKGATLGPCPCELSGSSNSSGSSKSSKANQRQGTGLNDKGNRLEETLPELNLIQNASGKTSSATFKLVAGEKASLVLFNASGQLVKELFNSFADAGKEVRVELETENLDPGIYYVILSSRSVQLDKKMLVMK